jgi:hypothetical protein
MPDEGADRGRREIRVKDVVCVEEGHHVAVGRGEAGVQRGCLTAPGLHDEANPLGVPARDRHRVVGGTVVDHGDPDEGIILVQRAVDRLGEVEAVVVVVDDDVDRRTAVVDAAEIEILRSPRQNPLTV